MDAVADDEAGASGQQHLVLRWDVARHVDHAFADGHAGQERMPGAIGEVPPLAHECQIGGGEQAVHQRRAGRGDDERRVDGVAEQSRFDRVAGQLAQRAVGCGDAGVVQQLQGELACPAGRLAHRHPAALEIGQIGDPHRAAVEDPDGLVEDAAERGEPARVHRVGGAALHEPHIGRARRVSVSIEPAPGTRSSVNPCPASTRRYCLPKS